MYSFRMIYESRQKVRKQDVKLMKNQQIATIELKEIYKNFGSIQALKGASFEARAGEVTAIVGDNGSGKSTLAKIISGNIKPDSGSLLINGENTDFFNSSSAIKKGKIATVYQDLALDDPKNCWENIFLGREITRGKVFLDKNKMRKNTLELLSRLGINIPDIDVPAGSLSGGQRQALAIARAIDMDCSIVIFDEPTSAMGMRETYKTMELFRNLKESGKTVILISHNLFQVFDIADRVAVLENGVFIDTFETKDSSPEKLHAQIVGKEKELARHEN